MTQISTRPIHIQQFSREPSAATSLDWESWPPQNRAELNRDVSTEACQTFPLRVWKEGWAHSSKGKLTFLRLLWVRVSEESVPRAEWSRQNSESASTEVVLKMVGADSKWIDLSGFLLWSLELEPRISRPHTPRPGLEPPPLFTPLLTECVHSVSKFRKWDFPHQLVSGSWFVRNAYFPKPNQHNSSSIIPKSSDLSDLTLKLTVRMKVIRTWSTPKNHNNRMDAFIGSCNWVVHAILFSELKPNTFHTSMRLCSLWDSFLRRLVFVQKSYIYYTYLIVWCIL